MRKGATHVAPWLQRNAARPGSHDDTSEGKRDPSNWPKIPDAMIEPMVRFETADRKARAAFWRLQRTDKTKMVPQHACSARPRPRVAAFTRLRLGRTTILAFQAAPKPFILRCKQT